MKETLNHPYFLNIPHPSEESFPKILPEVINSLSQCREGAMKPLIVYNEALHGDFIRKTHLLEYLTKEEGRKFQNSPYVGIFSSGSTGKFKLIFHRWDSLEKSAKVSSEIIIKSHQSFFNANDLNRHELHTTLPLFHMGGLLCLLRQELGTFNVNFHRQLPFNLISEGDTVIGVPAQLHTILTRHMGKKFTFYAGGDRPSPELLIEARKQKINVIPTYGLTESCGAIMFSDSKDKNHSFPDVSLKININKRLCFKTERQAKVVLSFTQKWEEITLSLIDKEGFFQTADIATLDKSELNQEEHIQILGRNDQIFICGGENIHPEVIVEKSKKLLKKNNFSFQELKVLGMPDERLGKTVVLFIQLEKVETLGAIKEMLEKHFKGPDRPRHIISYPSFKGIKPSYQEFLRQFERKKGLS